MQGLSLDENRVAIVGLVKISNFLNFKLRQILNKVAAPADPSQPDELLLSESIEGRVEQTWTLLDGPFATLGVSHSLYRQLEGGNYEPIVLVDLKFLLVQYLLLLV